MKNEAFSDLVYQAFAEDRGRGGFKETPISQRLHDMIQILRTDASWAHAYQNFVQQVSFARDDEQISFVAALNACERIALLVS